MEYADLLIALSRAGGIPAREINGYAYTLDKTNRPLSLRIEGGDVLHAWPQIYLPETGWTMIDPTWGSTSGSDYFSAFDLSHLTFVVKGISSEYPLPAGSYKTDPNQKDVTVSFSSDTAAREELPQLDLKIDFSPFAISPFPTSVAITIANRGKTASFETRLGLESDLLDPEQTALELGTIPPGGTLSRTIQLSPKNAFTHGEEHLTATVSAKRFDGQELSFKGSATKTVRPIYLPLGWQEAGTLLFAGSAIFLVRKLLLARLARAK